MKLLLSENGIKLTDHLSHGEYNINTLQNSISNSLLFLLYILLVKINVYFIKQNLISLLI